MSPFKARNVFRNCVWMLIASYGFASVFSPSARAQTGANRPRATAQGADLQPVVPPPSMHVQDPSANPPGVGPQRETFLFEFRHPQTKEKIKIFAPHTSAERLRDYSPKAMEARKRGQDVRKKELNALWSQFQNCSRRSNSVINELIEEIPIETLGFALFTLGQSWMMSGGDPGALKRLYEQNIADPVSYIAIVVFVGAFKGTELFFRKTGIAFDPCKGRTNAAMYQTAAGRVFGNPPTLPSPNRFQRIFGHLAPGIGMGVGMGMSVWVGDMLKDKDFKNCIKSKYLPGPVDVEACDRMYEEWVIGRKLNQYAPDIFSIMTSFYISSHLAMPAAMGSAKFIGKVVTSGAERYLPIVLRGVRFSWRAWNLSRFLTPNVVAWSMQIATMVVMVPIQSVISPIMKAFWNTWMIHGRDFRNTSRMLRHELDRTSKARWAWAPEKKTCRSMPMDPMGMPTGPHEEYDCTDQLTGLPEVIRLYGKRQAEWRGFLMQGPGASHDQWKDYVLKFQNTYTAAYSFYNWFVGEVAFQQNARKNKLGKYSRLFVSEPLQGVHMTSVGPDGEPVSASEALTKAITEIQLRLDDPKSRLASADRATLRRIQLGLWAADESKPISAMKNKQSEAYKHLMALPENEREAAIWIHRMDEVNKAIRLLNDTLETHPLYGIMRHVPFPSQMYLKLAKWNPFAAVRVLLGNPRPAPAGLELLRWADSEESIISQELKENHPKSMGGRMITSTMSDYLLASMVCGPEADPTPAMIQREQHRRNTGLFSRMWERITGDRNAYRKERMNMVDIQAVREDAKVPRASWMNPNKDLSLVVETKLIDATFYPPRLVKPLGREICKNTFPDEGVNRLNVPMFQIHQGIWKIGGRSYEGLLDIAKHSLRPEIFNADGTESNFDAWWARNVDPAVMRAAEAFHEKFYDEVLEGQFYPALTGEAVDRWVRAGNVMNEWMNGGALLIGVIPSLRAELKVYLELLERVHKEAPRKGAAADMTVFNAKRKDLETMFRLTTEIFMRPEVGEKAIEGAEEFLKITGKLPMRDADRHEKIMRMDAAFEGLKKKIEEAFDALKGLVLKDVAADAQVQTPADRKQKKVPLNAVQTRVAVVLSTMDRLHELRRETDYYLSLTKTVHLTGLYERGSKAFQNTTIPQSSTANTAAAANMSDEELDKLANGVVGGS